MAQLIGRTCALCHERIASELGATWCPSCGSPVHLDCRREGTGACTACGADEATATAERLRSAEEATSAWRRARSHFVRLGLVRTFTGLGCLAVGCAVFVVPYLATRRGHRVVWYGAIVFGAIQLVFGIVSLLRAYRRGPPPGKS